MLVESLPHLWKFDIHDESTWPYLDYVLIGKGENKEIRWIKNPSFKYGHLIKGYWDAACEGIKSKVQERNQQNEVTTKELDTGSHKKTRRIAKIVECEERREDTYSKTQQGIKV